MVLQNKYKARASKRYNASRGGISDGRGRGGGGRGRGSGRMHSDEAHFPSLNAGEEGEEGEGGSENSGDDEGEEEEGEAQTTNKYSRRKLESNAWRYQQEEVDPHEEAEAEPEPEIDLSGLLARVAKLDSSRTSKALSSQEAAESSKAKEDEDIDRSLLYLLDRQREREGRKGVDEEEGGGGSSRPGLTSSELKQLEMEGRRLLEEKERERRHYGRAQMLKTQKPKTISLNIGDNRRKDDAQPTRPAEKIRRNVNIATLYDDADNYSNGGEEDSVDSFLQQLNQVKEAPRSAAISPIPSPSVRPTNASANPVSSPSRLKEHEDFLDSII